MKTIYSSLRIKTVLHFSMIVAILFAFTLQGFAQTAAGTDIKNTASATYGDGSGSPTEFSTVSNEVVVTVARVAGLTITPDAGTVASAVPGQTGVIMDFIVTNTGNFNDSVRFLASGGSLQIPTGATATAAVIDPTGTPVDILTNGANVDHPLNAGDSVTIRVTLTISATAAAGSNLTVFLGDQTTLSPTFDNDAANSSASEVRTVATNAVNTPREARGDRTVTIQNDAQIRAELTAPAGPVALGTDITYSARACNIGARPLSPFDPDAGGPIPAAIYVVAPIPAGTELASALATPAGVYYSTSPLSTAPFSATWTATAPGTLSTVTRILIPVSTSNLAAGGACSALVNFDVTITTTNATTPIYEIVDGFGNNSIGTTITDQSGDTVANKGDGNANFDEPLLGGTVSPTQGFQLPTLLTQVFNVLNGPDGAAGATGPSDNNDDFTNKSFNTGIGGVSPTVAPALPGSAITGVTTASGQVTFTNTVQNIGNTNDTFRLTAPTVPTGSTVEIFDGSIWVDVTTTGFVDVAVVAGATADYQVRVTLPAGNLILTGYDTVIRATSQNDTSKANDTIDRVYTGFVRLDKRVTVANGTGVGAATDAVPGAVITYVITYTNVSSSGGSGSVALTANALVITENGTIAPNDWGATTDHVVGSGVDSNGGTVTGNGVITSTLLTDTVATLAPGASGTFTFSRTIK